MEEMNLCVYGFYCTLEIICSRMISLPAKKNVN